MLQINMQWFIRKWEKKVFAIFEEVSEKPVRYALPFNNPLQSSTST